MNYSWCREEHTRSEVVAVRPKLSLLIRYQRVAQSRGFTEIVWWLLWLVRRVDGQSRSSPLNLTLTWRYHDESKKGRHDSDHSREYEYKRPLPSPSPCMIVIKNESRGVTAKEGHTSQAHHNNSASSRQLRDRVRYAENF